MSNDELSQKNVEAVEKELKNNIDFIKLENKYIDKCNKLEETLTPKQELTFLELEKIVEDLKNIVINVAVTYGKY